MVRPRISVTRNTTVTFDTRKAKPVNIDAPKSATSVSDLRGVLPGVR